MYCLSLCIIILISGLFIAFIFIIYDIKEEKELIDNKNITLINNWVNTSEVVICNVENPCYVMCKEYPHSIDECGDNTKYIINIIIASFLGFCIISLLCKCCELFIGYIAHSLCGNKSTKKTQYGRV